MPDADEEGALSSAGTEPSPRGADPLPAAGLLAGPVSESIVEYRSQAMVPLASLALPLGSFAVEFPPPIIVITGSSLHAAVKHGHVKATQTSNDMFKNNVCSLIIHYIELFLG